MGKQVKTVIFDIGNVLMNFDWAPYMASMFDDPELILTINKAIWRSGLWNEMDRGTQTAEELLPQMQALAPGHEEDVAKAFANVGKCMSRRDYSADWIRELKGRGYRVLFLSNYSHYIMDANPDVLYFFPELEGGVWSCDVHSIKPEPEIFHIICEKYQLNAEECVFIDDNPDNIAAANSLHFHTVHFTEYEDVRKKLEAVLALEA